MKFFIQLRILLIFTVCSLATNNSHALDIDVRIKNSTGISASGRLFIMLNQDDETEPRFYSESPQALDEAVFAMDLDALPDGSVVFSSEAGHPYDSLPELPEGNWYVQALYDSNTIAADINSEGNLYSEISQIEVKNGSTISIELDLNQIIPDETLPSPGEHLRYFKMKSSMLSEFWGTDIYLRASALLPRTYQQGELNNLPVIFDVGGFRSRYDDRVTELMAEESFNEYWFDLDTPQAIIIFLDGEAPYGDSYQINSANNGPYGDATWEEFMPMLYQELNIGSDETNRFITGCSTGGWVSLAVQIFYPRLFSGAWSYSADGVDFRYFQLIDIYSDTNALVNEYGNDRPSRRDLDGEISFTMKQEISMENALGRGNTYTTSSGQWGGWNAVYSPRNVEGQPDAIWDADGGEIDPEVAKAWESYDLRKYLTENWHQIGNDLQGKLNIWMGDMDNYYLNNAMRLFEDAVLELTEPNADVHFEWLPETDHCDYEEIPMLQKTMQEMLSPST